jgi:hypothetical protein
MKQTEVIAKTELLTKNGRLAVVGYARHLVFNYDRRRIHQKVRIKEWDFYQILSNEYCLQMNIGHLSYVGSVSATLFNLKTGQRYSIGAMKPLVFNGFHMEPNGEVDHVLRFHNKNFDMTFDVKGRRRVLHLVANNKTYKEFKIDLVLTGIQNSEAMVIATPFSHPQHFYLNDKQNGFAARGTVVIDGQIFHFGGDSYGLIDWGRGVWPSKTQWYWGNGATTLSDGRVLGFNIGFGFGDLSHATENMLFVDGKVHKLEMVTLENDETHIMNDWVFSSSDGRFELTMTPVYDNYTKTSIGPIFMECHQVFGKFNGQVILDTGEKIKIVNLLAFCEHANNHW